MAKNPYEIDPALPFEHQHGSVKMVAERCDFQGEVKIIIPRTCNPTQLINGIIGIIGWHSVNIVPNFPPSVGHSGFGNHDIVLLYDDGKGVPDGFGYPI